MDSLSEKVDDNQDILQDGSKKAEYAETVEPEIITEGKAKVVMSLTKNVFYNYVQEFNRDLSIAVLRIFAEDHNKSLTLTAGTKYEKGLVILEALAASGLRSIRYALEIPGVKEIVANDISASAVASIEFNAQRNDVQHLVTASHNDATLLMYQRATAQQFNAIDLDPYGCPSQFLDATLQCICDGGLLLVTCTDMGVLSGNSPETCYSKYGAIPIRVPSCHEVALRIVLQCLEAHANRHGRYIAPLLSVSVDFYVRVFVKVFTISAPRPLERLSMMHHCVGCHMITLTPFLDAQPCTMEPLCKHCGHKRTLGGPIWSAPIHDEVFLTRLQAQIWHSDFNTLKRMQGMLTVIQEELKDVCLYYVLDKLSSVLHSQNMPMLSFRSALINAGYRVSYSHANKNSIKTDAPPTAVWDIMRCYVREHPVKPERMIGAALAILSTPPKLEASFEIRGDANPESRQKRLTRYQTNPQPFWGPGMRSKGNYVGEGQMEKKIRNQNKYTKKRNMLKVEEPPSKCVKTNDSELQ